ncbi:MAG TPA: hypothetical protein VGZ02_12755 [Candidatus Baltobacteraceae bacterium]|jgi:hypothetical protein|nr:hypothetical protein [Candidatus Baltobacteraceae bacterium]
MHDQELPKAVLQMREWGRRDISTADALTFISDGAFGLLSSQNVLQVVRDRRGIALRAFSYVGRCDINDKKIIVEPRLSCSYDPLIKELDALDAKAVNGVLEQLSLGSTGRSFIEAFISAAQSYFSIGRLNRYTAVDEASRFARGKIITPATIRLRARGRSNVVVTRRRTLSPPTLAHSALRQALLLAEQQLLNHDNQDSRIIELRSLSRLLPIAMPTSLNLLLDACDEAQKASAPYIRDLFKIVKIILLGGADSSLSVPIIQLDRAMFFDMAKVIENAVRRIVARSLSSHRVLDGNVHKQPFLQNPISLGEPDIVIYDRSRLIALMDVKDKIVVSASRDDVYQIFSHCVGAGANLGVLIFIGEDYESPKLIGAWDSRISLLQTTIRPNEPERDLRLMLSQLAIAREESFATNRA